MRRVVSAGVVAGFVSACAWVATAAGAAQQKPAPAKGASGRGPATNGKAVKNPIPPTPESIAAGKQIFAKNCVDCHGRSGKGDGNSAPEGSHPGNLTDAKWDHGSTDGEIFVTIRTGVGPKYDMDGFKDSLSEKDIWNVINYIRTIGPANAPRE